MSRKSSRSRAIYLALLVGVAVVLPVSFYASGLPMLGGVLLLSTVIVFAISVMKSGALSTAWLAGETRGTIGKATWREFAKALICAALAIDALFGGARLLDRYRLGYHPISWMVILTVAGLMAIAAGLFLTRWFAGYLVARSGR